MHAFILRKLADVPDEKLLRHQLLLELNSAPHRRRSLKDPNSKFKRTTGKLG